MSRRQNYGDEDLYEVLQISPEASVPDIKKAYHAFGESRGAYTVVQRMYTYARQVCYCTYGAIAQSGVWRCGVWLGSAKKFHPDLNPGDKVRFHIMRGPLPCGAGVDIYVLSFCGGAECRRGLQTCDTRLRHPGEPSQSQGV